MLIPTFVYIGAYTCSTIQVFYRKTLILLCSTCCHHRPRRKSLDTLEVSYLIFWSSCNRKCWSNCLVSSYLNHTKWYKWWYYFTCYFLDYIRSNRLRSGPCHGFLPPVLKPFQCSWTRKRNYGVAKITAC